MRQVIKENAIGRWFQDVAALASVAAMGWAVLVWGQIAQTAVGG
jgi:hypothetical protein